MNESQIWEKRLKDMGMAADIPTEQEKAKEAGVEVVGLDTLGQEFKALSKRLYEEDPRNVFGGFPTSTDGLVSLVDTLNQEWIAEGVPNSDISIAIHTSCINEFDCVNVIKNGGARYHYNTRKISQYSRNQLISKLKRLGILLKEV